jgi:hypothetical protein
MPHGARYSLAQYHVEWYRLEANLPLPSIRRESVSIIEGSVRNSACGTVQSQRNALHWSFGSWPHKAGDFEDALLTINGAVSLANKSGAKLYLAETAAIKARILSSTPQPGFTGAMDCLEESLAVAREQGALALELRSAYTLASWLSERGQRDQARHPFTHVPRFTEGFDTADLTVARRLIEEPA